MKKTSLIVGILFIAFFSLSAQEKFSREQLWADADTLYSSVSRIHLDLFLRYPQERFDPEFEQAKQELQDSMTAGDFYRIMSPVMNRLRDGHMQLDVHSVDAGRSDIFFPLTVDIDPEDYSMWIRSDYSDPPAGIAPGARILTVNGRTSAEIVTDFLPYFPAELDQRKIRYMSYFQDFQRLFYLLYGEDRFRVEYEENGSVKTVELPAVEITGSRLREMKTEWYGKPDYTIAFDEEKDLAILEFNRFSNPEKFETFIREAFREIREKQVGHLIIDIRQNGGGNSSLGDELFQYISPVPFVQFEKGTLRVTSQIKPYLPEEASKIPDGELYTYYNTPMPLRENEDRFTGKVYLLTSGASYSSAGSFPWAFRKFGMGTIIGEESGTPGVTFGNPVTLTLPFTKIKYTPTTTKYYLWDYEGNEDRGVVPDYEVPVPEALNFAIRLITE